MIRSIPNPPMDREDVARFRHNLEQHLRGDLVQKNDIALKSVRLGWKQLPNA